MKDNGVMMKEKIVMLMLCCAGHVAAAKDVKVPSKIILGVQATTAGANTRATVGVTGQVGYQFNPMFAVRGTIHYGQRKDAVEESGFLTRNKTRKLTVGALLDVHPFQNMFRLTGGLMYNDHRSQATVVATAPTGLFSAAQFGVSKLIYDFRKFAPYLGVGVDTGHGKTGWGVTVDAGFLFQGGIKGRLDNTTSTVPTYDTLLRAAAESQAQNINKKRFLKVSPLVSVGVSYRF